MSDLTLTEQKHVRTAMRVLRRKVGTRSALAEALHFGVTYVKRVIDGTNAVSASMALRVARLAEVPIDDLLAGRYVPGACPRCGYSPDFADESTNVEATPRQIWTVRRQKAQVDSQLCSLGADQSGVVVTDVVPD